MISSAKLPELRIAHREVAKPLPRALDVNRHRYDVREPACTATPVASLVLHVPAQA